MQRPPALEKLFYPLKNNNKNKNDNQLLHQNNLDRLLALRLVVCACFTYPIYFKHQMKIKRNYPTKRNIKQTGKSYKDYMKIEVEKGNMPKLEFIFWLDANEKLKKDSHYEPFKFYARDFKSINKPIPYNA